MKAHNLKYTVAFFPPIVAFRHVCTATDGYGQHFHIRIDGCSRKGHVLPCLYNDNGSFKVKRAEVKNPTAEYLREALAATIYKVTVYGDRIFVLPEIFLATSLPPVLMGKSWRRMRNYCLHTFLL